jgi:hypothetical protein
MNEINLLKKIVESLPNQLAQESTESITPWYENIDQEDCQYNYGDCMLGSFDLEIPYEIGGKGKIQRPPDYEFDYKY